jgi:hypothetical protein
MAEEYGNGLLSTRGQSRELDFHNWDNFGSNSKGDSSSADRVERRNVSNGISFEHQELEEQPFVQSESQFTANSYSLQSKFRSQAWIRVLHHGFLWRGQLAEVEGLER